MEITNNIAKISTTNFRWTEDHDVLLCREILVCEPYRHKPRSRESGQTWEAIANHLNAIPNPVFRVTERAVRDRAKLILKNYALKLRNEEKASGIDVEQTELEQALEEILEKEKAAKAEREAGEQQKQRVVVDKANAEEMRNLAMERMGETKKRKREQGEITPQRSRARRTGSDSMEFIRMQSEKDYMLKEQELELRRQEKEAQVKREREFHEEQQRLQQQQNNALQQMHQVTMAFMQQSQQQNQVMAAVLQQLLPKK